MKTKKTMLKKAISVLRLRLSSLSQVALAGFFIPDDTNLPDGTLEGIIYNIMSWLLGIVGVVGIIAFAIAGILYLTSAGNDDRIKLAKNAMTYSIIGVVVALCGVVALRAVTAMLSGNPLF